MEFMAKKVKYLTSLPILFPSLFLPCLFFNFIVFLVCYDYHHNEFSSFAEGDKVSK